MGDIAREAAVDFKTVRSVHDMMLVATSKKYSLLQEGDD
jgi:hypothetical protein